MTSPKQIESNRRNALISTGPKSVAGKRRSAKNALAHGLRSTAPIIPGESPAAWEKHRDGVIQSLAPANVLESELAERAALLLWRLRRVAAHEQLTVSGAVAETAAAMHQKAADLDRERKRLVERREDVRFFEAALAKLEELPSLADAETIPKDFADEIVENVCNAAFALTHGDEEDEDIDDLLDSEDDDGEDDLLTEEDVFRAAGSPVGNWTAAQLRRGIDFVAEKTGATVDDLLATAADGLGDYVEKQRREIEDAEKELPHKARQLEMQTAVGIGGKLLPENVELLTRYESHVSRQLNQTLQTLEALQSSRQGRKPASPL